MKLIDPNAASLPDSGVFGLGTSPEEAALIYLPVPWEATVSYGAGTADGPEAVLEASRQVDLFDLEVERPYEAGLAWLPEYSEIREWDHEARQAAEPVIEAGGQIADDPRLQKRVARVNALGEKLNAFVETETAAWLDRGKVVGVVGGEHSVPFGAIRAVANRFGSLGILHFDAHSDTRDAFEGFQWSHASIYRNVLDKIPQVEKLVQVGIRDFCEQEVDFLTAQGKRVEVFFDSDLARAKFEGQTWKAQTEKILECLPQNVWVSFDIDGLDPRFCPNTGTPVPGGLDFNEAVYVLSCLARSGRRILGFDLSEVAPGPLGNSQWDGNVGARLLYKLSAFSLASQNKARWRV